MVSSNWFSISSTGNSSGSYEVIERADLATCLHVSCAIVWSFCNSDASSTKDRAPRIGTGSEGGLCVDALLQRSWTSRPREAIMRVKSNVQTLKESKGREMVSYTWLNFNIRKV